jgi:hypothetical protein
LARRAGAAADNTGAGSITGCIGESSGCRYFVNWFDETPRDPMRRQLLVEVSRTLAQRLYQHADESRAGRDDNGAA